MMARILVVDDEPAIRESLVYALEREGFAAAQANSLQQARAQYIQADLIVLDLMLGDGNGLDFLTELKRSAVLMPIIVLTSRDEEIDRIVGLELGADDYVTKPFSPREVVARVKAVLRRLQRVEPSDTHTRQRPYHLGLSIEPASRRAWFEAHELALSKTEFDLLAVLLRAPGRVYERSQLLDLVWGTECAVGDRTVDVHLKSLRSKIRDAGGPSTIIETVRGVGYRLREAYS